ncbi:hypothetical protein GGF38_006327, partial [Coemansia sp. RSA 25]
METHGSPSGGRGLREHHASDASSMHKQRWQQSPAFATQSLSLPTSPAAASRRVSPLLQPDALGHGGSGSSVIADCELPIILMGSVKQRGDKNIVRQSGNAGSAKPSVQPPQPTRVEPSSLGLPMDAPRPQAVSPVPEPLAASGGQASALVYNGHWTRAAPPSSRPKSLYEGSQLPGSCAVESGLSPLRVSSSIASAKAFLTMIAADQAKGSAAGTLDVSALTIATSDIKGSFRYGSPGGSLLSPALASAPVTGTAGRFGSFTQIANATQMSPDGHVLGAQDMAAAVVADSGETES